ncbi:hypothetical protein IGW14_10740 [Streptomyces hygroscopicus subsp. hygroscopicus]|uniref:hypothetical protein n=1 Tax=Streptomyces TaxID=1883 RepID=UPI001C65F0BB|nr:hypothetical protein [Streptomyces hygroscopicus]MBW8088498.1 hypothetical protein [Streptomyces hygroscopicus subsp. hygroscopicus]
MIARLFSGRTSVRELKRLRPDELAAQAYDHIQSAQIAHQSHDPATLTAETQLATALLALAAYLNDSK